MESLLVTHFAYIFYHAFIHCQAECRVLWESTKVGVALATLDTLFVEFSGKIAIIDRRPVRLLTFGLIRRGILSLRLSAVVSSEYEENMKDSPPIDLDYNVWQWLTLTRHAILKVRQKELDRYNIHAMQVSVLFIIQAIGDKATPAQISRWLIVEPHSISELLTRIEKQGLVRKSKDLDRKNLVRVALTEKGRKAYNQSTKRESIHKIMSSLSEGELKQLRSYLQILRHRALEELGRKPEMPL